MPMPVGQPSNVTSMCLSLTVIVSPISRRAAFTRGILGRSRHTRPRFCTK